MQSSTFGRLCITQRIDVRETYTYPKKGVHYTSSTPVAKLVSNNLLFLFIWITNEKQLHIG